MGQHNFYTKLDLAAMPLTGGAIYVPGKGHLLGWGPTASLPTGALTLSNGDPVWAPGAIWIDTTTKVQYYNNSTTSTVSFAQAFSGTVTALVMSGAAATIAIKDNEAAALDILEGTTSYLKFVTTNSGEKIVAGKNISGAAAAFSSTVNGLQAIIDAGGSTVLTAAQSGSLVLLNSSDLVQLPVAAAGIWFDFLVQSIATQTPRLDPKPDTASVFCTITATYGEQADGKYVAPTAIGNYFRLVSDGTNWFAPVATVFTVEG